MLVLSSLSCLTQTIPDGSLKTSLTIHRAALFTRTIIKLEQNGSDDLGGKDDFTTEVKTRIILPDHQSPPHSPIPDLVMDDGNL